MTTSSVCDRAAEPSPGTRPAHPGTPSGAAVQTGMTRRPPGAPGWADTVWDVVVVGGGNAALAAAMSADDLGARVLVLERAPQYMRGGNSRHTRNIRCVHDQDEFHPGAYSEQELWQDLCNVGEGPNVEELARFTVRDSESIPAWMYRHGARWQHPLSGTLQLGRTNRFFLGGGKALLNAYYRYIATRSDITVAYDAKVEDFEFDGDACQAVIVCFGGVRHRVRGRSFVCASGGFEANIDWLRRYWGDAADNYIIRGTPYNDGHALAQLYAAQAASVGHQRGFHAIAVDARAPRFDGGIATRLDTVPFGIVLNSRGDRFYDEGEDAWPKRYATWGRHIAEQPDQIAYCVWDAKVNHLFLRPMYPTASAETLGDLLRTFDLDQQRAAATVEAFNDAVVPGEAFDISQLDGCHTEGLTPPKSNWAQPIDTPPYYGVAMRPGVTFTYMGVSIGPDARVVRTDGSAFTNVYAAGEIMSGNILSTGYLAGFGMTIGSVWGRRAGAQAAQHASEGRR